MITITKDLKSVHNDFSEIVIMSDDDNVIEFSSTKEESEEDFKFRIEIKIFPQGSNTAVPLNYTTNRQYGYVNLYSIINSRLLYSGLGFDEIQNNTAYNLDLKRSILTVKITESWRLSNGSRFYDDANAVDVGDYGGGDIRTIYIHKGISKSYNFNKRNTVKFSLNTKISTIFRGWFYGKDLKPSTQVEILQAGASPGTGIESTAQSLTGSDFNLLTSQFNTSTFTSLEVVTSSPEAILYKITKDDCVENNIINWMNDMGFYDVYNFEHSKEIGSKSQGQDFYTNNKKTAIVSSSNTVTLVSRYIDSDTHNWLLNILKSPSVYWNGIPVTPKRVGVNNANKRFEQLISLAIEFEISERERSVLL